MYSSPESWFRYHSRTDDRTNLFGIVQIKLKGKTLGKTSKGYSSNSTVLFTDVLIAIYGIQLWSRDSNVATSRRKSVPVVLQLRLGFIASVVMLGNIADDLYGQSLTQSAIYLGQGDSVLLARLL